MDAESEFQRAFEAIKNGHLELASRIASWLLEQRYSGSFEIEALVCQARGDIDGAIGHLDEGLEVAEDVWRMWQLRGNLQSELEQYDEADDSYRRALECTHASVSSVRYNQAVVRSRRGEYTAAIELLETLYDVDDLSFSSVAMELEFECRRQLRGQLIDTGSIYEVLIDVPATEELDEEEGGEDQELRFIQKLHVAAGSPELALQLLIEDLGSEYTDAVMKESKAIQDAAGYLAGVYWLDLSRYHYPAEE